jgi:hypothetical protein
LLYVRMGMHQSSALVEPSLRILMNKLDMLKQLASRGGATYRELLRPESIIVTCRRSPCRCVFHRFRLRSQLSRPAATISQICSYFIPSCQALHIYVFTCADVHVSEVVAGVRRVRVHHVSFLHFSICLWHDEPVKTHVMTSDQIQCINVDFLVFGVSEKHLLWHFVFWKLACVEESSTGFVHVVNRVRPLTS